MIFESTVFASLVAFAALILTMAEPWLSGYQTRRVARR
jgi:hypothetical protein